MNEQELTDKLREKYVEELNLNHKKRTVEEALQQALDNTTPEHAGAPDKTSYELVEEDNQEWL